MASDSNPDHKEANWADTPPPRGISPLGPAASPGRSTVSTANDPNTSGRRAPRRPEPAVRWFFHNPRNQTRKVASNASSRVNCNSRRQVGTTKTFGWFEHFSFKGIKSFGWRRIRKPWRAGRTPIRSVRPGARRGARGAEFSCADESSHRPCQTRKKCEASEKIVVFPANPRERAPPARSRCPARECRETTRERRRPPASSQPGFGQASGPNDSSPRARASTES